MIFILMHKDNELLKFSVEENLENEYKILWLNKENKHLLPLDLVLNAEGIEKYIKRRNIPKNRAYVTNFLSKCGLSINKPIDIIKISKGLSLNDCYWFKEDGYNLKFKDINLYDNNFSRVLALIAFTGYRKFGYKWT